MCPKSSFRLKNGFYPLHFMAAILSHRWDSSLLPTQPAKRRLCAICVIFLFGTEFGLYVFFLRCAGCFLGAFHRIEKQPAHLDLLNWRFRRPLGGRDGVENPTFGHNACFGYKHPT